MSKGPDFFSEKATFCAMWIGFIERKGFAMTRKLPFIEVSGRGGGRLFGAKTFQV
jgi:hypothetical protein